MTTVTLYLVAVAAILSGLVLLKVSHSAYLEWKLVRAIDSLEDKDNT